MIQKKILPIMQNPYMCCAGLQDSEQTTFTHKSFINMDTFEQREIRETLVSQEIFLCDLRKRDCSYSFLELADNLSFHRNKPKGGLLSHPAFEEVNKAIHDELEFQIRNNLYRDRN